MRSRAGLVLVAAALVLSVAAAPAGASSSAWQKNTFHVTSAGVFHAYFLMPRWPRGKLFFIQVIGPTDVSNCKLRYGRRTVKARSIDLSAYPDIFFYFPKRNSPTQATAICDVSGGGGVGKATVVLSSRGVIKLRRT